MHIPNMKIDPETIGAVVKQFHKDVPGGTLAQFVGWLNGYNGPVRRIGLRSCKSGSIASGGRRQFCTCDGCF